MQKQLDKINQPLGHIDGMFQHGLTGWFHGGLEGSNIVQLRLNGEPVTSTQAVDSRPDVEEFHGFGKNSGFTFDVRALEELGEPGEIFELTISDSNNVFNFGGATIRYCVGTAKWYNEIQAIFDANFYRSRYNLCNLSRETAFRHFINGGIFEAMDPCPWFSSEFYTKNYSASLGDGKLPLIAYLENESTLEEQPAYNFDPNYYYKQYADIATVISPLAHYVRHGRFENRSAYENVLPAVVLDEYEDILELEPKLSTARSGLDHIVRYPHNNEALHLSKLVHDRVGDDIKVVVCVPFISRGGADLISTFLFRAYQTVYGKEHVLMLVTDKSSIDVPEWIDDGSQVICLDDEATFVNAEDKLLAFHSCIGKIAPEKILNVNSHLAWRLFERHGMQLASVVDLYAFLFCFDYNKDRDKVGYIVDYLPKTLRFLKKVYFDNKKIIEDIERIYGFSAELRQKLHTVYVPAAEGLEQADYAQSDRRDTVLWVGRLSLQKRPDVLVEIAKLLPGQKFDVYGPPGNSEYSADIVEGKIPNINYRGVYNSLDEIDCSQYSSFLNTSEWDGLPTIIIQMMALGLPVVTSAICGIPELINDQNGWPVSTFDDPEEYAITLRKVSIKKQLTVKKTNKAKADVMKIHQWQSFYKRLELLEAFSDFSSNERAYAPSLERRQTA